MTDLALTEHDRSSGLWLRLVAHLESRLQDARRKNDGPLNEYDTATLRGEIRALRHIIGLGDSRPLLTGDDDQPG
jgi:hypothetical protein